MWLDCANRSCKSCGSFTCTDCDAEGLSCAGCLIAGHQNFPFHSIREWNGKYFEKTSLNTLGYILHLNHGGYACPHLLSGAGAQEITILDVNGIHSLTIGWCRCYNAPELPEQLLTRQIIPATLTRPQTAFTFRVLRLFHMLNHVARTTPWDFTGTMTRLTDNIDMHATPVCYRELFLWKMLIIEILGHL